MLDFEPEVSDRWCAEDLFGVRVKPERLEEPPTLGDEFFATGALCLELSELAASMQPPARAGGFGDDASIELEPPWSPADGILKRETTSSSDGKDDASGDSNQRGSKDSSPRTDGRRRRRADPSVRREKNRRSAQLSRERRRAYVENLERTFDVLKERLDARERALREARSLLAIAAPETHSLAPALRRIGGDAPLRRRWRGDFAARPDSERREIDASMRDLRAEVTGARPAWSEAPF